MRTRMHAFGALVIIVCALAVGGCAAGTVGAPSAPVLARPGVPAPSGIRTEPAEAALPSAAVRCDAGQGRACYELGLSLGDDERAAVAAFRKACQLGANAACTLALAHEFQFEPLQDHAAIAALLCEHRFASACKALFHSPWPEARAVLHKPTGPRIGYVKRPVVLQPAPGQAGFEATAVAGAKLVILDEDDGVARVALASFASAYDAGEHTLPPTALVASDALGGEPLDLVETDVVGIHVRDHARQLRDRPGGALVGALACGSAVIVEERGGYQKVAQTRDGVTLQAWVAEPIKASWGTHPCMRRLEDPSARRRGVPRPFEPTDPAQTSKRLASLMRGKLRTFWIEPLGDGATCTGHTLTRDGFVSDWARKDDDGRTRSVRPVTRQGTRLELHLTVESRDAKGKLRRAHTRCMSALEVVAIDDTAIHLLPAGPGTPPILGYIPGETERWWRSRQACEAHLAKNPRVPLSSLQPASTTDAAAHTRTAAYTGC